MAQVMKGSSDSSTLSPLVPANSSGLFGSEHCLPLHYHFHSNLPNGHYHHYHLPATQAKTTSPGSSTPPENDSGHVTVVQIEPKQHQVSSHDASPQTNTGCYQDQAESEFITVLNITPTEHYTSISATSTANYAIQSNVQSSTNQKIFMDNKRGEIEEEVTIYRLPGERLGMALRFDGGQSASETIRRVFVQNISSNSPASKAIGLMIGILREGDEILKIDGRMSCSLTRLECITLLRDAPVCIRLLVRRSIGPALASDCCSQPTCSSTLNSVPNFCPSTTPTSVCQSDTTPIRAQCNRTNELDSCGPVPQHVPVQRGLTLLSSDQASLVSASSTPMLNQLINSWDDSCQQAVPKKTPPPVPPRMATTTLSSKRKPKPKPIPPEWTMSQQAPQPLHQSTEAINSNETNSPPVIPIEKPPRRKNLHNASHSNTNNPPLLPPRRPKGPPPKPPVDRIQSSVLNVTISSASVTSTVTTTSTVPSLVTVITTKVAEVSTVSSGCSQSFPTTMSPNVSSINITSPSSVTLANPVEVRKPKSTMSTNVTALSPSTTSSMTSKVTFTISNSKVSSFIRQTAEKLHRKLSGKSASVDEDEESKRSAKSSIKISSSSKSASIESNYQENIKPTFEANSGSDNVETVEVNESSSSESLCSQTMTTSPPNAALYVDTCMDNEDNSCFESDTDDTSSSVSTIIERGTYGSSSLTDSIVSQLEHSPYFAKPILSDNEIGATSSTVSIIDRVLSPFERLENEIDNDANFASSISLSSFNSALMYESMQVVNTPVSVLSSTLEESSKECEADKLSPNKLETLISDEQSLLSSTNSSNSLSKENLISSLDSIPVDIDSRRDELTENNLKEMAGDNSANPQINPNDSLSEEKTLLLEPPKEFASDEASNEKIEVSECQQNTGNLITAEQLNENKSKNLDLFCNNDEEDDEDLNVIKNDIISRVEDDKDDFMLDTDYLNESSSRYLYHHSGSELILAPYSELTSITEEDEELDDVVDNKPLIDADVMARLINTPESLSQSFFEANGMMNSVELNSIENKPVSKLSDDQPAVNLANFTLEQKASPINDTDNDHKESEDLEDKRALDSGSVSPKVSLNNVFDFLNEATDDFEFVERMLELTNDKIDSIDDIMRIRESLRGLQQSEQKGNLEKFLDSKDVIDELMALSSSSHSSASSENSDCNTLDASDESGICIPKSDSYELHKAMEKPFGGETKLFSVHNMNSTNNQDNQFVSLPLSLNDSISKRQYRPQPTLATQAKALQKNGPNKDNKLVSSTPSRIPTLIPKLSNIPNTLNSGRPGPLTEFKRSQSVSNIFNRSNGFNSMIELRPSLIPRPISNFNLSSMSSSYTAGKSSNSSIPLYRYGSHSCLNRSTSMQSLPSNSMYFNSLSRSVAKNKGTRRPVVNHHQSTSYHHNCCQKVDSSPPTHYYGSLSRSVSKSSTSVYHTGSLPRTGLSARTNSHKPPMHAVNTSSINQHCSHNAPNLRTTSLTDLSYGFVTPNHKTSTAHHSKVIHNPTQSSSSRRHASSGNLFLCDSFPGHATNSDEECGESLEYSNKRYHSLSFEANHLNQTPTVASTKRATLPRNSHLRTSSSLVSLLPGHSSQSSSNFWHCSHHTSPVTKSALKRNTNIPNNTTVTRSRSNQSLATSTTNRKLTKVDVPNRKPVKVSSNSSSTSSASSTKSESEDTQHVPQTRSILRFSAYNSKYKPTQCAGGRKFRTNTSGDIKDNIDFWNSPISKPNNSSNSDPNSYSDSESSDITISSGDSADYLQQKYIKEKSTKSASWQTKRRNSHKVCFVDEIIEHRLNGTMDTNKAAPELNDHDSQCASTADVRFYSPSPEMPILSSSTSISSISSLSSSSELPKSSNSVENIGNNHDSIVQSGTEHLHENNATNLNKVFFVPSSTQREDSGIFASDDTSTSEFSQSPSPELLMGSENNLEKLSTTPDKESKPAVNDRPVAFDSNKQSDLSRSLSCNKPSLLLNSLNSQILSRSSSAPYETHCEMETKRTKHPDENILLTPPQSPPNERTKVESTGIADKLDQTSLSPTYTVDSTSRISVKSETIAFPITIKSTFDYQSKTSPFSLRDNFIYARRHQNVCKLKGLIIPESLKSNDKPRTCSETDSSVTKEEIDLPTIISEEVLKIKKIDDLGSSDTVNAPNLTDLINHTAANVENKPIEITPIKPAASAANVPKYSPMFKRRQLSLPSNPQILYESKSIAKSCTEVKTERSKPVSPPAVPPKPVNQLKNVEPEILNEQTGEQSSPPPLPPKRKDINLTIIDEDKGSSKNISDSSEPLCLQNSTLNLDNCEDKLLDENSSKVSVHSSEPSHLNEFVINQKQYTIRAIVFELDNVEADLGIILTGGLDSTNKEVTVEQIATDSLADRDGRLQRGDRIVSINGKLLMGLTHKETVDQLQSACATKKVMIVFSRPHDHLTTNELSMPNSPSILASMSINNQTNPLTSSNNISNSGGTGGQCTATESNANYKTIEAEITKDVTGLGFIIEGGKNSSFGDRPISIKRIFRGGPVDKEGSLLEGDEILMVNEQSFEEMTRAEAWNFLKQVPDGKVQLVTRRKRYF